MGRKRKGHRPAAVVGGLVDQVGKPAAEKAEDKLTTLEAFELSFVHLCKQFDQMGEQLKLLGQMAGLLKQEEIDRMMKVPQEVIKE